VCCGVIKNSNTRYIDLVELLFACVLREAVQTAFMQSSSTTSLIVASRYTTLAVCLESTSTTVASVTPRSSWNTMILFDSATLALHMSSCWNASLRYLHYLLTYLYYASYLPKC